MMSTALRSTNHGTRLAALALHAMLDSDRDWVLNRLGQSERMRLHPLLEELVALGLPREIAALEAATKFPVGNSVQHAVLAENDRRITAVDRLAQLDSTSLSRMIRALHSEPPMLIARLLLAHDWPWTAQLRSGLGQAQDDAVQLCILAHDKTLSPGAGLFEETLIERILRRIEQPSADGSPDSDPPAVEGIQVWARAWQGVIAGVLRFKSARP